MARIRFARYAVPVLLSLLLAACAAIRPEPPRVMPGPPKVLRSPARPSVEGSWTSPEGATVSQLRHGVFTTVAADSRARLASGNYEIKDGMVEISGYSMVRQSPLAIRCLHVAPNQMNCTNSDGKQFVLRRAQGGV
ncbi:hypothetical protein [Ciceribacter sp. RN22]|uniref:hypothetical protein n=1 Tax=Ciceribacter sp. RN22 TaxID=2954932 RepID=UPI0020932660|nr:hypothetical protein [Ciceribacter sp. RN22]MCO6181006.1 hypothetical protein [Ciceribacter sp. RN22]